MAGSVNKVIIVGVLGRDPETRTFQRRRESLQPVRRHKRTVDG